MMLDFASNKHKTNIYAGLNSNWRGAKKVVRLGVHTRGPQS